MSAQMQHLIRHDMIQRALHRGEPGDSRPESAADASVRALDSLFSQLEPLVGVQGTRVLYARCVHLARSSSEWPATNDLATRDELLSGVREHLVAGNTAEARRASEALLNALADLLASLVGEPLTLRLLQSAWPENPK